MSTIVVAKKNGETAIAADTLTSAAGIKLSATYKTKRQKILKWSESYLGFVGCAVHQDVFESLAEKHPADLNFSNSKNIFETFLKLHPILKEQFFLSPPSGDAYESSDMNILIANPNGIYEVDSDRKVTEFEHFWATGSGRPYALGAMYQAYDSKLSAAQVALAGVLAATEFDQYSALPYHVYSCVLRKVPEMVEPVMI